MPRPSLAILTDSRAWVGPDIGSVPVVGVGVDRLDGVGVDGAGEGGGGDVVVGRSHRGEGGVGEGRGAGLVGPGVVGEPGGEPLVLAGRAEGLVDVAPPGSGAVHTLTVALVTRLETL